jgi:glycosyltransferase involved in cell wall biosynthesis
VIKALNEEDKIAACLASVQDATQPYPTQIIVADSRSDDDTVAIAGRFGTNVVRLAPSEPRGCGIGAQLGFQYSTGTYVLVMDGDMRLDPAFLPEALQALEEDESLAGVAGRLDLDDANLEYRLRRERDMPHLRPGLVDRLDGGGVYRRAAIDAAGYLTNRNLHSYEEFELALRLRAARWRLMRLAATSVYHYGHQVHASSLLLRRWRSRYSDGQGEVLRATLGTGLTTRAAREFWLSFAVIGWWGCVFLCFLSAFARGLPWPAVVAVALFPLIALTLKRRSLIEGCYSIAAWQITAGGLIRGLLRPQVDPRTPVAAEILNAAERFPVKLASSPEATDRGSRDAAAARRFATSLKPIG